jgi:prepilin-type N-terminal cleavage/methylation domain-containing protein
MKNGFSLIEVMISIAIIAVIGVISVAIFTQTLRTSSQTEILSKLKQNGEQAVNVMDDTIRNAEAVVCYGPSEIPNRTRNDRIVIRTLQGKYIKFRFVDPTIANGKVTGNGYIVRQEGLNPALLSTFCTSSFTTTNEIAISNNADSSGVSISDGQFIRKSGNLSKDTINVSFNVNQTKSAAGGVGQTAFISTTIQVR